MRKFGWLMLAVCLLLPREARATDPLDAILGDLSWGAPASAVLEAEREQIMDAYRLSIAGEADPLVVDQRRREADAVYATIVESLVALDNGPSGYEVSVLRGELALGAQQSLLRVRDDLLDRYYVFEADALRRIVVVYDQADLQYVSFEPFVERLEPLFGPPASTVVTPDELEIPTLRQAAWQGETTRLRVENRSEMFASYILVYDDASWTPPQPSGTPSATPSRGNRAAIGAIMNRIEAEGSTTGTNETVVDQLTGTETTVELRIRTTESEGSGESASASDEAVAAEPEESTPTRTSRPSRPAPVEEREDDGGEIVY